MSSLRCANRLSLEDPAMETVFRVSRMLASLRTRHRAETLAVHPESQSEVLRDGFYFDRRSHAGRGERDRPMRLFLVTWKRGQWNWDRVLGLLLGALLLILAFAGCRKPKVPTGPYQKSTVMYWNEPRRYCVPGKNMNVIALPESLPDHYWERDDTTPTPGETCYVEIPNGAIKVPTKEEIKAAGGSISVPVQLVPQSVTTDRDGVPEQHRVEMGTDPYYGPDSDVICSSGGSFWLGRDVVVGSLNGGPPKRIWSCFEADKPNPPPWTGARP